MAFDVEATTSGSPSQLCELTWRQNLVGLAGELGETVDNHRTRRQIHPESQCLGGVDKLHEAGDEQFLSYLLEERYEAGVMGCDAPTQRIGPMVDAQCGPVRFPHRFQALGDVGVDGRRLAIVVEHQTVADHGVASLITTSSTENEVDCREQVGARQLGHHLVAPRRNPGSSAPPATVLTARLAPGGAAILIEASAGRVGLATIGQQGCPMDLPARTMVTTLGHQVVGPKTDRTPGLDDHVGRPPHRRHPVA